MSFVADQTPANNCLPPTGQQDGEEATLPPEGHPPRLTTRGHQHTVSPAQALYGAPLVLPNQYLSINNEQTMNEFIIQIDNILKNLPMTRHNTEADKELPEYLPQEL